MGQCLLRKTEPKQAFRSIRKCFQKKLLQILKKNFFFNYWLTNCLPTWGLQTRVTQQWLRLQAWIFHCLTLLQPEEPYRCTCNALFTDLPVLSFVTHSSLFTTKSVELVVGMWWLPFITEISIIFIVATLIAEVTAVDSYCYITGWT